MNDVMIVLLIDGVVLSIVGVLLVQIHHDLQEIIRTLRQ
jgi:hypothetical protein